MAMAAQQHVTAQRTLVASTTLSRLRLFSQVPMYCSVRPCVSCAGGTGYISAVCEEKGD